MDKEDIPIAIVAGVITALCAAVLIALFGFSVFSRAQAQENHIHGADGIPDWYDSDCCNLRDCHPVEDSTIDFALDEAGRPVVIHTYDTNQVPIVYDQRQWRKSKDERFHACYYRSPTNGEVTRYCVYLRAGM